MARPCITHYVSLCMAACMYALYMLVQQYTMPWCCTGLPSIVVMICTSFENTTIYTRLHVLIDKCAMLREKQSSFLLCIYHTRDFVVNQTVDISFMKI